MSGIWLQAAATRTKYTLKASLAMSKRLTSVLPRTVGVALVFAFIALFAEVAFSVSPKPSTELIYGGPEARREESQHALFEQGVAYAATGVFDEGIDDSATLLPVAQVSSGAAGGEGALLFNGTKVTQSGSLIYSVGPGDTTFSVAQKNHVNEKELIKLNKLADGPLIVGDQLLLPLPTLDQARPASKIAFNGDMPKAFKYPVQAPVGPAHGDGKYWQTAHDLPVPVGTPVAASADGIVLKAFNGWNGGYGNYVVIEHPDFVMDSGFAIQTLYAHLSDLLVVPGDKVKKGQVIGLSGSTGHSTGPHVHFEIRTWE